MSWLGNGQVKVQRYLARHRTSSWAKTLYRASSIISTGYENGDHDPRTNGEADVLAHYGRGIVFDVGANQGDWTELALQYATEVHAFELVPSSRKQLAERFGSNPRVSIADAGLADREAVLPVSTFSDSELASLVTHSDETIDVRVTTGDSYCERYGITKIDLLKIDTEGAEMMVLEGFATRLAEGSIGAIQFEYGQAAIVARNYLKDFYELLSGYRIGKVYPGYVDFRAYTLDQEDFKGPNFLAVRE